MSEKSKNYAKQRIKEKRSYKQILEIKEEYRKNLLALNPKLDNQSGIYFFIRKSEQNENEIYVGQSVTILDRCISHMMGYDQYVDKSIKAHKLYDAEKNPYGYRIEFLHCPKSELDEKEQYYIKLYEDNGWILKNKTAGGQIDKGGKIGEYKPPKTYRQGILQGRKNASREIAHLFDLHLEYKTKSENPNKNQQKALEKFKQFLEEYKI